MYKRQWEEFAKRLLDITVSLVVLLIGLPLWLLIALLVKVSSKGPVFFVQERVGRLGQRFEMVKFRSMFSDDERTPSWTLTNDPRVTNVGQFIRKTSLDEIPQLINVFTGDMSLVGPRAMSVRDVDLFDKGIQRKRFSVRPGIVCLREVSGRSQLTFDRWLELDLQYIDTWSLALDFQILLRVIPVVLKGSGAS